MSSRICIQCAHNREQCDFAHIQCIQVNVYLLGMPGCREQNEHNLEGQMQCDYFVEYTVPKIFCLVVAAQVVLDCPHQIPALFRSVDVVLHCDDFLVAVHCIFLRYFDFSFPETDAEQI